MSRIRHKHVVIAAVVAAGFVALVPVVLVAASYAAISPYKQYVGTVKSVRHEHVGIVLGAGITKQGKPFRELQARLDVAAEAVKQGKVDKLILSGDNRFKHYDEPTAMIKYLTQEKGIARSKLQPDFAGRSTYESCERASKVFGVKRAVIFSAESHLPRAIYLCRHFGVTAYGVGSGKQGEAKNGWRREPLARVKAVYNVHVSGEPTVLGKSIAVN